MGSVGNVRKLEHEEADVSDGPEEDAEGSVECLGEKLYFLEV
jgi:hypothetical protein